MDSQLYFFGTFLTKIISNIISILTLLVTFWVMIDRRLRMKQNLLSTYNQKLVFYLMLFAFMYSISNILYPSSDIICNPFLFSPIVGFR